MSGFECEQFRGPHWLQEPGTESTFLTLRAQFIVSCSGDRAYWASARQPLSMLSLQRLMLRNGRPSALWCFAFLPLPSLTPGGLVSASIPDLVRSRESAKGGGPFSTVCRLLTAPHVSPHSRGWADFAPAIRPSRPIVRGIRQSTALRGAPGPSSAPVVSRKAVLADRRFLRFRDPRLFRAGTFARDLPFGEAFRQILRHTSTSSVSVGTA